MRQPPPPGQTPPPPAPTQRARPHAVTLAMIATTGVAVAIIAVGWALTLTDPLTGPTERVEAAGCDAVRHHGDTLTWLIADGDADCDIATRLVLADLGWHPSAAYRSAEDRSELHSGDLTLTARQRRNGIVVTVTN